MAWRVNIVTPPAFTGTGTTTSGAATITAFAASFQGLAVVPLAGQQVAGTGIPAGATVATSPAPTATAFSLSANATASGLVSLTIGAEPVTLAEAKAWAQVSHDDDDAILAVLVQACRERAEVDLKRSLMLQSRALFLRSFSAGILGLPYPPVRSVVSVVYIESSSGAFVTLDPSAYQVNAYGTPGEIAAAYGTVWPVARADLNAVQVVYVCGYGALAADVPASTRMAIRSLLTANYRNREAFTSVGGFGVLTPTPMYLDFLLAESHGTYS